MEKTNLHLIKQEIMPCCCFFSHIFVPLPYERNEKTVNFFLGAVGGVPADILVVVFSNAWRDVSGRQCHRCQARWSLHPLPCHDRQSGQLPDSCGQYQLPYSINDLIEAGYLQIIP